MIIAFEDWIVGESSWWIVSAVCRGKVKDRRLHEGIDEKWRVPKVREAVSDVRFDRFRIAWVAVEVFVSGVSEKALGSKSMRRVAVGGRVRLCFASLVCRIDGGARSKFADVIWWYCVWLSMRSAMIGCAYGSGLGRSCRLSDVGSWTRKVTFLNRMQWRVYGMSCCNAMR